VKDDAIPKTIFGQTGQVVTVIGLGGEGVLRTHGQEEAAEAVIGEAIGEGITYFDSAKAYAGSEEYYGRVWSRRPETRDRVFQASKSASRDRKGAEHDLDGTLKRMGIHHLDLWQIHDVRTEEDFLDISGPEEPWRPSWKPGKKERSGSWESRGTTIPTCWRGLFVNGPSIRS